MILDIAFFQETYQFLSQSNSNVCLMMIVPVASAAILALRLLVLCVSEAYQLPSQSNSHVYLMIIVPVAVVVVLALTAICCLCQRRKLSQVSQSSQPTHGITRLTGYT